MSSFRTPPALCPACGATLDATTPLDGKAGPNAGDVTLCFYCAHLMIFVEKGKWNTVRSADPDEVEELMLHRKIAETVQAIRNRKPKPPAGERMQ